MNIVDRLRAAAAAWQGEETLIVHNMDLPNLSLDELESLRRAQAEEHAALRARQRAVVREWERRVFEREARTEVAEMSLEKRVAMAEALVQSVQPRSIDSSERFGEM
jgi:hypothetical protein